MASETFIFAAVGIADAANTILRDRNRFKRFFEIAETYARENDLALFLPGVIRADPVVPETFNYILYARDDARTHAYALADLFYKASKDKTVVCLRQMGDYVLSVRFRKLMRVRLLRAWAHVDEHVPAPMTGSLVHMFSNFLVLLNVYRKLMDPLGSGKWNELLVDERSLRSQIIETHPTIDLVENREEPHKIFSDVMDLIRDSPRIIVDPYVIAADKESRPAPKSKRVQYVTQKKLEEEEVIIQNILEGYQIDTSIRNLKVPGFEHVQKLSVSVLEGGRSTSVVDVFNFGSTMLVPHIVVGDLKMASLLMTGFTLLLDYINVPSVAEVSDFMIKKKKFLLSKLKIVGKKIDAAVDAADADVLFPKQYTGVYIDPFILEKMLTKGPPESYVPFEKYKILLAAPPTPTRSA